MATLKDIAREAGVSSVTVSNVINGNYKKVSAQKIELINQIIEKYHYTPNATARSLAVKKSNIIGVVVPYITPSENFLKSPYNAQMLGIIEKNVRNHNYYLMVKCVEKSTDVIPVIHTWNVDGIIALGVIEDEAIELTKQLDKHPIVFVDTYTNNPEISNICIDDERGGYIATKYLIQKGHRDICFVGPNHNDTNVVEKRYNGYISAMKECGFESNIRSELAVSTSFECGLELAKKMAFAKPNITAIFTTADILALGLMQGLRLCGKRVPEDISIIGFDNLIECRYAQPMLTTVSQNIEKKADMASDLLFKMIENGDKKGGKEMIDVELVERQSVIPI